MTATASHDNDAMSLLAELRLRGLHVRADGDRLKYAPMELLDRDQKLRARVVAAKPELLRLLAAGGDPPLNQGLAVREVEGFPARLLPELPLPTSLVLDHKGKRLTWSVHRDSPPADHNVEQWIATARMREKETVGHLLARLNARLVLVIVHTAEVTR